MVVPWEREAGVGGDRNVAWIRPRRQASRRLGYLGQHVRDRRRRATAGLALVRGKGRGRQGASGEQRGTSGEGRDRMRRTKETKGV